MRVVSLLPSATELLCEAGGADLLVGRSHECDWPAHIRDRPVLTAQRTDPDAPPDQIDEQVSEALASGESLYTLDTERLAALDPDVILTQDLCRVCSVDLETVRGVAGSLPRRPQVVSLNPQTVEDVLDDLLRVGEATGLAAGAERALFALRERFFRAADYVNPYTEGPNVAFLEWTDPPFIGGHWTPQLIERAGGRHPLNPTFPFDDAGAGAGHQGGFRKAGPSKRVSPQILVATQPEALIVCPCGIGLDRTAELVAALEHETWWNELPAVRAGRVALVDGNHMFNRPGPRLVDAFEWLVGWFNGVEHVMPEGFPWRSWSPG